MEIVSMDKSGQGADAGQAVAEQAPVQPNEVLAESRGGSMETEPPTEGCIRKLEDVEDSDSEGRETLDNIFGDDWLGKPGVSSSESDDDFPKAQPLPIRKSTPKQMPSHISVIAGDTVLFKCTICVKTFKTKDHIRYHAYCGQKDKPFKCHLCSKSFSKTTRLDYHIKTHTGERPFTCLMCGKSFLQLDKLKRHKRIHFGNNIECDICNEKFRDRYSLNVHKRLHVEPPVVEKCGSCSKSFKDKYTLKRHVNAVHSSAKLFVCEHCGEGFDWKSTLVNHLRTHSGVRAFACDQCSRTFKSQSILKMHLITHLEGKDYRCDVCEGTFKRRDNLIRHLRNIHPEKAVTKIVKVQESQPGPSDELSYGNSTRLILDASNTSEKETRNSVEHPNIVFNHSTPRNQTSVERVPSEASQAPSDAVRACSSSIIRSETRRVAGESELIPSDLSRVPTESSRIPHDSRITCNIRFVDSRGEDLEPITSSIILRTASVSSAGLRNRSDSRIPNVVDESRPGSPPPPGDNLEPNGDNRISVIRNLSPSRPHPPSVIRHASAAPSSPQPPTPPDTRECVIKSTRL